MRIVCPSCDTAYMVPDEKLAPGRIVRCGQCGQQWMPALVPPAPTSLLEPDAPGPEGRSRTLRLPDASTAAPGPERPLLEPARPERAGTSKPEAEATFWSISRPEARAVSGDPPPFLAKGVPGVGPADAGIPFARPSRPTNPATSPYPGPSGGPDDPARTAFSPPSGARPALHPPLTAQGPHWRASTPWEEQGDRTQRVGDWPIPLAVWIGWALTLLMLLLFAVIAYAGRDDIMQAWPPSVRFYTALGWRGG
jgi:predicted Zn finger-like uncharacterized protein